MGAAVAAAAGAGGTAGPDGVPDALWLEGVAGPRLRCLRSLPLPGVWLERSASRYSETIWYHYVTKTKLH